MDQILTDFYENVGEAGSLSSLTTLARVASVGKELATEYLKNELCYTILQNHRI